MDFLSRKARSIAPYTAGEQLRDRTYVKLNTNENPYPPSPRVKQALLDMDADGLRRYPRPDAGLLRAAIARKCLLRKRLGRSACALLSRLFRCRRGGGMLCRPHIFVL